MKSRTLLVALALLALVVGGFAVLLLRGFSAANRAMQPDTAFEHPDSAATNPETLAAPDAESTTSTRSRIDVAQPPSSSRSTPASRAPPPSLFAIFGRVTEVASGNAPPGRGSVAASADGQPSRSTSISADGEYTLSMTAPGRYALRCSAEYSSIVEAFVEVTLDAPRVRHDFVIVGGRILHVALRDPSGRPLLQTLTGHELELAAALRPLIVGSCPARGAPLPAGTSTPVQRAQVRNFSGKHAGDGWYDIHAPDAPSSCACALLGNIVVGVTPVVPADDDVVIVVRVEDLRASTGSLELTVIDDALGTPIQNASVSIYSSLVSRQALATDENGHVRIEGLTPGAADLTIAALEYMTHRTRVEIAAQNRLDLGLVRLKPAVEISGKLVFPGEHAQDSDLSLLCYPVRDMDHVPSLEDVEGVASARNGQFHISGLRRSIYLVTTNLEREPPLPSEVRRGSVPGWIFVDARQGSVSGLVLDVPEPAHGGSNLPRDY